MGRKKNEEMPMNVLVVDDEEVIREVLKEVLTEAGYKVWTAKDGEEAIEKMKEAQFSVVITDIKMPGMDGVQVTRKFKELDSDTEVVVITGYASIDSAVSVLKEGAYDYITKPFNVDEIKIVVGRAAEHYKLLQEAKEKEKYKQLAIVDALTGVYNRRYLDETLPREIERAKRYEHPLGLLMIDIDYFKRFNDSEGHLAGDWALKKVAQLIAGNVRGTDLVFRYGGEEFVVLLPETDKAGSVSVAQRIKNSVSRAEFLDSKIMPTRHLTVSIGIAVFPEDAQTSLTLIDKADSSLYAAKRLGRNRICFLSEGKEKEV